MNKVLFPIIVLLSCACLFSALSAPKGPEQDSSHFPQAGRLLADVRAQLPQNPMTITGDLQVRKRKGIVTRDLRIEMFMNMSRRPAIARYTIRDAFGSDLEQLTVTREAGKKPLFEYKVDDPLVVSNLPDLFKSIQDTNISWMDLTFSFLWWPGGTTVKEEIVKGQSCFVVDLPAPSDEPAQQYAKVLLWIDKKFHMILQAEGYDAAGKLVRRLWVKSFKKINERWMIKDMEVQSFPSIQRTRLRVRELREER